MSTAPATIAIRRPRRSDAAAVANIHEAAWREAYLGILPGPTLDSMIARRGSAKWADAFARSAGYRIIDFGGECAGYSHFGGSRTRRAEARAEIYELYLAPEYQGLGLGRRLFAETRALATKAHGAGLIIWALAANERAAAFYRALGGREGPTTVETLGGASYDKNSWLWK
jgi:ribosomal protein S18 acetylase RimI-like enzyme